MARLKKNYDSDPIDAEQMSGLYVIYSHQSTQRMMTVKIGISKNIKQRVTDIANMNAHAVSLDAAIHCNQEAAREIEGHLHYRFAKYRTHGEWFCMPSDRYSELLSIELICGGCGKNIYRHDGATGGVCCRCRNERTMAVERSVAAPSSMHDYFGALA